MNIPIIVQVRMSSERLPGKVMEDVNGKPLLEYTLDRLRCSKEFDRVIVATSKESSDDLVYEYCVKKGQECFRGDLENVALRFKQLIEELKIEAFVRICGDSPMIDSKIIDDGLKIFKENDYEIVTNNLKRTFPKGQSFQIIRSDVFLKGYEKMTTKDHFEHVALYFLNNVEQYRIFNIQAHKNFSSLEQTIDQKEDLERFRLFVSKTTKVYTDYSWEEIVQLYNGESAYECRN